MEPGCPQDLEDTDQLSQHRAKTEKHGQVSMDLGPESQVSLSRDNIATQGTLGDHTLMEKGQVRMVWEVLEGRRFSLDSFGTDSLASRVENSMGSKEDAVGGRKPQLWVWV